MIYVNLTQYNYFKPIEIFGIELHFQYSATIQIIEF